MAASSRISIQSFRQFIERHQIRSLYEHQFSPQDSAEKLVRDALASPLDYPPIDQAILPGERIAIVVHRPLPQVNQVTQILVRELNERFNCEVSVVYPAGTDESNIVSLENSGGVNLVTHDPDETNQLAMIAIDPQGEALYVNRAMFDADVVIPVSCFSLREQQQGLDCVVPKFLGRTNQDQFAELNKAKQRGVIRLVSENLGTFVGIQVVLGPGGEIGNVLAGESAAIREAATKFLTTKWRLPIEERYSVVVASLEGPSFTQTWEQFANALMTAQQCAAPGAALVVYSELTTRPRGEWRAALSSATSDSRKLTSREAMRLAEIATDHPIYLISGLNDSDVEALGMGPINELDELERLIARQGEAILVRDADQAVVEFVGEPAT